MASGQYTLSMRPMHHSETYFRSNQRHDSGNEVKFEKL